MSHRSTLRTAVLSAVAAGAVLVPAAAAFATDATPTPVPSAAEPPTAVPTPTPTPATDNEPPKAPRGGVAAGERPVENGSDATALYGAAIGTVLLAGAGTLVLRRRTVAHRDS